MKVLILAVGDKRTEFYDEAIREYVSRIDRVYDCEVMVIRHGSITEESIKMLQAISPQDRVYVLDERGRDVSSPDMAMILEKAANEGVRRLVFIIGGAYGVSEDIRLHAYDVIAYGRAVYPHELIRVMLVEQIYRGTTIIQGKKYHHE